MCSVCDVCTVNLRGGLYLPYCSLYSCALLPNLTRVKTRGVGVGGGGDGGGISRGDGGRDGRGVVGREVPRGGATGAVDGAVTCEKKGKPT